MFRPARSNLIALVVVAVFWFLTAWQIVSLRPGSDWWVDLIETIQIFLPGFFLIWLLLSIRIIKAERHQAIVRKDLFGGIDVFKSEQRFLFVPFFFEIVACMPIYPLRFEASIDKIDTRSARLALIEFARLRCDYAITDFKACLTQSKLYGFEVARDLKERHSLKPTDEAYWPLLLDKVLGQIVDDNLRTVVWSWQQHVEANSNDRVEPLSRFLPRQPPPSAVPPPPPAPQLSPGPIMENDPYDLSLNREKVAGKLEVEITGDAAAWGISFKRIVFEHVEVSQDLIAKRNRSKPGELDEAQHQAKLDYIAARARGMAEAEVRAQTVKRLLEELAAMQGERSFPELTEKTIAEIVRAALYSDGDTSLKTFLDKPHTPPPGTAKTA